MFLEFSSIFEIIPKRINYVKMVMEFLSIYLEVPAIFMKSKAGHWCNLAIGKTKANTVIYIITRINFSPAYIQEVSGLWKHAAMLDNGLICAHMLLCNKNKQKQKSMRRFKSIEEGN